MELSIRIDKSEFEKLDIADAMDGNKVDIKDALLMSMHFTDGAIDKAFEKAESWDNLPDEIKDKYK